MSEKNIIETTNRPNTLSTLYDDLLQIGIKDDDILLVHSSLSSLGWVCGGAQTVVTALLKSVGVNGTLVMPAHSGDWSDPAGWGNPPVPKEWIEIIYNNMPPFNPKTSPTRGMGRIAELFRTFPNTIRSNHPLVSFSANGKEAIYITENHYLTPQLGMDSPIGKMYDLNTKVLLLGVTYNSCTCFHLAETFIKNMPKEQVGTALLENDKPCWKWFNDFEYNTEDFELLGRAFEEKHNVRKTIIGNAECRLFNMKEAVDFAKKWLNQHRQYKC
ncbi:AAC(3) family N-acetyltransferase [Clostridium sp. SHJSY1]|uniref:aminoglycoside N(3)-acetyltransferase n=1 Tax=Clostridium sp. SHJSY1 TaxID=2942483 RepID=UPI0028743067|nr:AAC(3) family N-acetyltransferase [Clostridium sp. SHJSY1]MDS0524340.1 AAC(3) family N-acetyltransferase [Clostridium sp. SHJSY1]